MKFLSLFIILSIVSCGSNNSDIDLEKAYNHIDSIYASKPKPTQPPKDSIARFLSQIAQCAVNYVDRNGKNGVESALGFILNNNYFATCQHVYDAIGRAIQINSIEVICNLQNANPDTVKVDLHYKYKDNQFDFSKHRRDQYDPITDFTILKLVHPVKTAPLIIGNSDFKKGDTLYSFVAKGNGKDCRLTFEKSIYLTSLPSSKHPEIKSPIYVGGIIPGASGCPVFNRRGEFCLVNAFGFLTFYNLKNIIANDPQKIIFSDEIVNYIEKTYNDGGSVTGSFSIKDYKKFYFKGF